METAERFATLQEIAGAARQKLSANVWDYMAGGAESETTLKRNRLALDSIAFKPRVLRDVAAVDCSATLLGVRMPIPVAIAPCGSVRDLDPEGTLAVARAAEEFGVASFLSASSPPPPTLEEIAAATRHPKVFQLSVRDDPRAIDERVERAIDAGYRAIGFTLDGVVPGRRERDLANRHVPVGRRPGAPTTSSPGATFTWDSVKRFRDTHETPLVLKAIVTGEDAALAVEHGADVIYVSNHGGRQLDHARATIEALPEVVQAARGKAEIMFDGGILRGTDVLKAIALGADAVAIGRLMCLGLAAAGQAGVVRVLELLADEIGTAMALLAVTDLDRLDESYLVAAQPVARPGLSSAYPLIPSP